MVETMECEAIKIHLIKTFRNTQYNAKQLYIVKGVNTLSAV